MTLYLLNSPIGRRSLLAVLLGIVAFGSHEWRALGQTPVAQAPSAGAPPPAISPLPVAPPVIPHVAPSTPKDATSLVEFETMALAGNPSLRRASAMIGAARGSWVQAGLLPNPVVGYQGQQIGSGGLAEQHGVVLNQDIVMGGKLGLSQRVAEHEIEIAQQEWEIQRQRVLTDVRIAYFQVLAGQRQIDLTRELLRVSQQGVETVDKLLKSKEVGRADLLQAELEVENAIILARNAQNRHDWSWRNLATVVGDSQLTIRALSENLFQQSQELSYDSELTELKRNSPEVSSAAIAISRAEVALERARAETIPNISVQGLVNWQDNGVGGQADGAVGIVLPWPLFNKNQGNILRAEHEVAAAKQALSQTELDLTQRFAGVFERYQNARYQVERYQTKLLPAAAESLNLTRDAYVAGETSFTSLLTAQRTFAQMQLNYLDALLALRIAESEITGRLLRDSYSRR